MKVKSILRILSLTGLTIIVLVMSGCADLQNLQKKFNSYLGLSGTRSMAVKKYNYKGTKDALFVERASLAPAVVAKGGSISQKYKFAVLAPNASKRFRIQEVVTLSGEGISIELSKKVFEKDQAIHISTIEFTIPRDLPRGSYKLITDLSIPGITKQITGTFSVR